MRARFIVSPALAILLGVNCNAAPTPGSFDHFRCMLTGHWDNVRQASNDALLDKDEQNAHPRRAMTYIPVFSPELEGQLFAILNYAEQGFDGPPHRLSLHRFRWAKDERRIIHEFVFLKQPEAFGDLQSDITQLAGLRESDFRVNDQCAMRWNWFSKHFEGSTKPGACVTDSFTDQPILVEGHGELRQNSLIRHDRNFELSGAPIAIPGGATPEMFDRVSRTTMPDELARQIDAVATALDCASAES